MSNENAIHELKITGHFPAAVRDWDTESTILVMWKQLF